MADWINFKNQGPWDFTKQPNKWAYLNNKRWSDIPEAVTFSQSKGYKIDPEQHDPCGHWHLPEIIPPVIEEFPVGRCYGWDALLTESYAFTWDNDYKKFLKIDLNTLQAIDYLSIAETNVWKYQVIDICYRYGYLVFSDNTNFIFYKIDLATMQIVSTATIASYLANNSHAIRGGAADNATLYLTTDYSDYIIMQIPVDLSILTISFTVADYGAFNGARGIKVDPTVDIIYATGSKGTKVLSMVDLELLWVCNADGDIFPHVPGSQNWEGGSMQPYFDIWTVGYHPMNPRAAIGCGSGSTNNPLHRNPVHWNDWCCGSVYSMGFDFFSGIGSSDVCSIERIQSGGGNSYFEVESWWSSPVDLFGYEVACNRIACKPVTKSITAPVANPTEIGTWLTKFDSDCSLLEWREKLLGYKTISSGVTSDLEPQVWRY
jgi:hypothetical protein